MKKLVWSVVASTALLGGSALAADLQVKAPVYKAAPVPVYSWTGCYIGGHVGGLWARKDWNETGTGRAIGSHDADDILGGFQAGCNYQVNAWVFGLQGDYAWTDATGTNADLIRTGSTDRTNIRSLSSITGRVGHTWGRFLGYVKGGVAWERDNYDVYVTTTSATVRTASETRGGWTLGIGGEYAFTDHLSGFVEYNYYDFGTRTITFSDLAQADIKERKSVLKGGVNWKFNMGPVIARY